MRKTYLRLSALILSLIMIFCSLPTAAALDMPGEYRDHPGAQLYDVRMYDFGAVSSGDISPLMTTASDAFIGCYQMPFDTGECGLRYFDSALGHLELPAVSGDIGAVLVRSSSVSCAQGFAPFNTLDVSGGTIDGVYDTYGEPRLCFGMAIDIPFTMTEDGYFNTLLGRHDIRFELDFGGASAMYLDGRQVLCGSGSISLGEGLICAGDGTVSEMDIPDAGEHIMTVYLRGEGKPVSLYLTMNLPGDEDKPHEPRPEETSGGDALPGILNTFAMVGRPAAPLSLGAPLMMSAAGAGQPASDQFMQKTLISESGMKVSVSGNLNKSATLNVSQMDTSSSQFAQLSAVNDGGMELINAVEVKLDGGSREAFRGDLDVSFTVGNHYNGLTLKIGHMRGDGVVETLYAQVVGGIAKVRVSDLSPFVLTAPRGNGMQSGPTMMPPADSFSAPTTAPTTAPTQAGSTDTAGQQPTNGATYEDYLRDREAKGLSTPTTATTTTAPNAARGSTRSETPTGDDAQLYIPVMLVLLSAFIMLYAELCGRRGTVFARR